MATEFSVEAISRLLSQVGEEIKREVGALIPASADELVGRLESRYPIGAKHDARVPHMRDDIRTRLINTNDSLLPARKVIGPRLGYIWQNGTRERVDATRRNARRGRMPAADPNFFERTSAQTRERMLQKAQDILNRPREIG